MGFETRVVVICQLACVGSFLEAVGQGCVRFGCQNWYAAGEMSGGGGTEGDVGLAKWWMVRLVVQPS